MKKVMSLAVIAVCCGAAWSSGGWPRLSDRRRTVGRRGPLRLGDRRQRQPAHRLDSERNDLTKKNVRNLKMLWKIQPTIQVRALHSLMPVLIIGRLNTPAGTSRSAIVNGISDNLYAFDVESGKILWQKHWDYPPPAAAGGGRASANPGSGASRLPAPRRQQRYARHRSRRRAGPPADLFRHRRRHAPHAQRRRRQRTRAAVHVPHRQGLVAESGRQRAVDGEHLCRGISICGRQGGRSAAQSDDLQCRQRRRVGPARRGNRLDRHRLVHDRRRHLRPDLAIRRATATASSACTSSATS